MVDEEGALLLIDRIRRKCSRDVDDRYSPQEAQQAQGCAGFDPEGDATFNEDDLTDIH